MQLGWEVHTYLEPLPQYPYLLSPNFVICAAVRYRIVGKESWHGENILSKKLSLCNEADNESKTWHVPIVQSLVKTRAHLLSLDIVMYGHTYGDFIVV